jgi:hypothetical protein
MSGKKLCRHIFFYVVKRGFVGFKKCAGTMFNVDGLPKIFRNTLSNTISPRISNRFVFIFLFINTVLSSTVIFSEKQFSAFQQYNEGHGRDALHAKARATYACAA